MTEITQEKEHISVADRIAHIISVVFSPLLVPTYGVFMTLWISVLSFLPAEMRWGVVSAVFVITCVIPLLAILGLWRMGYLSHPSLNSQKERTVPYIITGLCYLGCTFYLSRINAPGWLTALPAGGCMAVAICSLVNARWKISAHMAAMGGLLATIIAIAALHVNAININVWLTVVVIMTGLVGSSRVQLKCHTLAQVLAGLITGFVTVFLLAMTKIL